MYVECVAGVCGMSCRCVWRELQVCVEGVAGVCGGSCRCVSRELQVCVEAVPN